MTISGDGRVSGYPRVARSGNELVFAWTEGAESEGMQQVRGGDREIALTAGSPNKTRPTNDNGPVPNRTGLRFETCVEATR